MSGGGGLKRSMPKLGCRAIEEKTKKNKKKKKKKKKKKMMMMMKGKVSSESGALELG